MIRHIVLFRQSATDPEQRRRDADQLRDRLEGLVGVVPGVSDLRVGPDLGDVDGHWDLALVSHHASVDDLRQYATDPRHREVIAWVDGFITERAVVDVHLD